MDRSVKNEFGLNHNESGSLHGWHRHVSLVMLAFATMAVIRRRRKNQPPHHGKSQRIATSSFIRWSSKLKALLRKVAARTTRTLCRRIGSFVPRLSAKECAQTILLTMDMLQ